ncbi:MAG: hypothetical protein ACFFFG_15700 [Candidatus Thorarchaeota archaeon]
MSDLEQYLDQEKDKKSTTPVKKERKVPRILDRRKSQGSLLQLSREQLLEMLAPVMAQIPGHASNLAWTRQKILPRNPQIHPEELARLLSITPLEAYWILAQLRFKED